jgi:hypothetical protein
VRTKINLHRAIACLALWLALAGTAAAEFTFAALGDTPYTPVEEIRFVEMIGEINREELAFAVHVGDFKHGRSACSDEMFLQRREWFELFRHPFIFVPGDNEWTDCRRRQAGGYRPLERLEKLRELFFSGPWSLGQRRIALERQALVEPAHRYPEHARWIHGEIVFATLNVPGPDNNFQHDREEFRVRDAAVRDWIGAAFRLARERKLRGVVLMMQANPWAAAGARRHGFVPLLKTLTAETLNFPGKVVLIHGDTHRYRADRPLLHPDTRRPLANFLRIEVFGSPTVNWVRVRVTEQDGRVEFEATPGS